MDGTSDRAELGETDGTGAEDGNQPRNLEEHIDYLMDCYTRMPEWFHLKEKSKSARQAKAQETRERNRRLHRSSPSLDTDDDGSIEQEQDQSGPPMAEAKATERPAPKKRRLNRPRKESGKVLKPAETTLRVTRSSARRNLSAS